ncbi:hypothetical protein [Campylobacter mucosalis]|uniref:Flagellar-associated protein FlgQ n=1 Tax=Campylobacter mucosalis CCUG 21559 TaxID=1032067 RepID=A0A6G5QG70_9BACT|nr:hypothetical protein [Campylobacter mucosalis]QCD44614.1 flagellar-associated protein FlgQ [Campylobacter mucosalis CCUG 21559]
MARSLFILVFLLSFVSGEQFIFSALLDTKDGVVRSENISIVRSKIELKSPKFYRICEIETSFDINNSDDFFSNYKSEIFECFFLNGAKVSSAIKKSGDFVTKNTTISILPIRFIINFKPNSVIISTLKYKAK